jgi:hypothetical protein
MALFFSSLTAIVSCNNDDNRPSQTFDTLQECEDATDGSKIITNLFYRPKAKMRHLVVAAEVEYAERRNIRTASNNTTRASFLIIYDF